MNTKGKLFFVDFGLLIPALILVVLGLATIYSISGGLFITQVLFVIIGLFVFLFFSNVHYKVIAMYSTYIYIVSLILLTFVLFLGLESHGAVRWIDIFGLRIQFSEILKPFLLISLSAFLSERNRSFKTFLSALIFLLPVLLLIFLQPDLGNAVIYAAVAIGTLVVYGFSLFWFSIGAVAIVLVMPVIWHFLHDYQRARILTFLSPGADPLGSSYNSIQAIIAVGSGMFFGKGLGQATQSALRFLPERHTDFIFATLSESLGFVGGVFLILVFGFLLYRIFLIFKSVEDPFRKIFCSCAFLLLLFQGFVNIGMNIGLSPVVGVTLPFVSYGGSSIVSSFILLGLISSFSTGIKSKDVLEIS